MTRFTNWALSLYIICGVITAIAGIVHNTPIASFAGIAFALTGAIAKYFG